jgi:transcriptional regulator with XRE-family HTH domain
MEGVEIDGHRLRAMRKLRRLSLERLSGKAGISRTALIGYENGRRVAPAQMAKLAAGLGLSPELLEQAIVMQRLPEPAPVPDEVRLVVPLKSAHYAALLEAHGSGDPATAAAWVAALVGKYVAPPPGYQRVTGEVDKISPRTPRENGGGKAARRRS